MQLSCNLGVADYAHLKAMTHEKTLHPLPSGSLLEEHRGRKENHEEHRKKRNFIKQ